MENPDIAEPLETKESGLKRYLRPSERAEKGENSQNEPKEPETGKCLCIDCPEGICSRHAGTQIEAEEISEGSRIWGLEHAERFLTEDGYKILGQESQEPGLFAGA